MPSFNLVGLDTVVNLTENVEYPDYVPSDISASYFMHLYEAPELINEIFNFKTTDPELTSSTADNDMAFKCEPTKWPNLPFSEGVIRNDTKQDIRTYTIPEGYHDRITKNIGVQWLAKNITGGYNNSDIFSNESALQTQYTSLDSSGSYTSDVPSNGIKEKLRYKLSLGGSDSAPLSNADTDISNVSRQIFNALIGKTNDNAYRKGRSIEQTRQRVNNMIVTQQTDQRYIITNYDGSYNSALIDKKGTNNGSSGGTVIFNDPLENDYYDNEWGSYIHFDGSYRFTQTENYGVDLDHKNYSISMVVRPTINQSLLKILGDEISLFLSPGIPDISNKKQILSKSLKSGYAEPEILEIGINRMPMGIIEGAYKGSILEISGNDLLNINDKIAFKIKPISGTDQTLVLRLLSDSNPASLTWDHNYDNTNGNAVAWFLVGVNNVGESTENCYVYGFQKTVGSVWRKIRADDDQYWDTTTSEATNFNTKSEFGIKMIDNNNIAFYYIGQDGYEYTRSGERHSVPRTDVIGTRPNFIVQLHSSVGNSGVYGIESPSHYLDLPNPVNELKLDTWSNINLTVSNQELKVYNCVTELTHLRQSGFDPDLTNAFSIGASTSDTNHFNGDLASFLVLNKACTPQELVNVQRELYPNAKNPPNQYVEEKWNSIKFKENDVLEFGLRYLTNAISESGYAKDSAGNLLGTNKLEDQNYVCRINMKYSKVRWVASHIWSHDQNYIKFNSSTQANIDFSSWSFMYANPFPLNNNHDIDFTVTVTSTITSTLRIGLVLIRSGDGPFNSTETLVGSGNDWVNWSPNTGDQINSRGVLVNGHKNDDVFDKNYYNINNKKDGIDSPNVPNNGKRQYKWDATNKHLSVWDYDDTSSTWSEQGKIGISPEKYKYAIPVLSGEFRSGTCDISSTTPYFLRDIPGSVSVNQWYYNPHHLNYEDMSSDTTYNIPTV